ncbi:hypothetical protein ASO20_01710 [Mycoplasma sp. (ex Biomphalaria glabrata)]|uniref:uracil-DNA glycosylase n=1 Tax=Mycoplasma sp. (ex Biomphalaria glabrata) TaxID=1749074 RepID=UPI00073A7CF6|nr:uracil-DNA glycosylase [Mycoplasma sp. (ex Biomphalaria glabrata)]ALV23364.1 hypothetical protein ASO20_01710 [Mycoplasma sp. (ex Biomphalaria glabrata)]
MLPININTEWKYFLEEETNKEYFQKIILFLDCEYKNKKIYPKKEDIFRAFSFFNPLELKVVIIGQDPYPSEHADGLAFSSQISNKTPASLRNINREIFSQFKKERKNNNLIDLAEQGILLINSRLTVEEKIPLSHKNIGWEKFLENLLIYINSFNSNIVFLLWGTESIKCKKYLSNSKFLILESPHPSPLSCYRGFFGNNHFQITNNYLKLKNTNEIRWWSV